MNWLYPFLPSSVHVFPVTERSDSHNAVATMLFQKICHCERALSQSIMFHWIVSRPRVQYMLTAKRLSKLQKMHCQTVDTPNLWFHHSKPKGEKINHNHYRNSTAAAITGFALLREVLTAVVLMIEPELLYIHILAPAWTFLRAFLEEKTPNPDGGLQQRK